MSKIIKPPTLITTESIAGTASLALFGSIEQGKASEWQKTSEIFFEKHDVTIYNPRRDNWNFSWKQSIDNPQFVEQVEWELKVLENVNVKLFYFDPTTQAPITLLELGLSFLVGSLDTIVCCPEGYWRKGNVDIVCRRYGIHTEPTLDDALREARSRLVYFYKVPRLAIEPIAVEIPLEEEAIPFVDL